jgi:LAO/AO transport system kinase
MDAVWAAILEHRDKLDATGELGRKRRGQQQAWFWSMLRDGLERQFLARADVRAKLPALERDVIAGTLTPTAAAGRLLALLDGGPARKD